jgi:SAM-dependent methyltransferase
MTGVRDQWSAGETYEGFMGRWSRRLASKYVDWLGIPADVHWLDVGCGTGSLTQAICNQADPASVIGCDPAVSFIEFAREQIHDPRVSLVVAGIGNLPRRPGGYASIASLLALNFFPDPEAAVDEMRSIIAPKGTVSACVWDYGDGMQFLRYFWDAATALDSGARMLDEGNRFPLCRRDTLTALFSGSSFGDVRCEPIEISTTFASFDDYWRPFLGGTGPAPAYVAALDSDHRTNLAQKLGEILPRRTDGTISLTAQAWAVRGKLD